MLHFWLDCITRAFWASAFFTGTNRTGFVYALVVAAASLLLAAQKQAKLQGGWRAMKRSNWTRVFGEGAAIALAAWAVVFFFQLVAAPHVLYSESEGRAKRASDLFAQERKTLTEKIDGLRTTITETKTDCALKEGINQTLEKQNRDQQSTINGCLSQAMKLLTPEPMKITPVVLDNETISELKKVRWLVIVNKTITPVQMNVVCNKPIENGSVWIVGTGILGGGAGNIAPQVLGVNISTPAWSPTSPLLVTMSYRGADDIVCSFQLR
jgi:hypothetical protein